jgi:hypothetical protein
MVDMNEDVSGGLSAGSLRRMPSLLVVGGRDRSIIVWKEEVALTIRFLLDKYVDRGVCVTMCKEQAHTKAECAIEDSAFGM